MQQGASRTRVGTCDFGEQEGLGGGRGVTGISSGVFQTPPNPAVPLRRCESCAFPSITLELQGYGRFPSLERGKGPEHLS